MNFISLKLIFLLIPNFINCEQFNNFFLKINFPDLLNYNISKTLDYISSVHCASFCAAQNYPACQFFFIDSPKKRCNLGHVAATNDTLSSVTLNNPSVFVNEGM